MKKYLAFTLIELLVVIAIIGILSGLIVVSMSGVTSKATIAKAQVFSNSLRNSLMGDIVSEWKFDDSSSIGLDSWGTSSGTNSGAVVGPSSECLYGFCLKFDGIDDVFSVASFNLPVSFTINFWIRLLVSYDTQPETYPGFTGKGGVFTLEISKSNGGLVVSGTNIGTALYSTRMIKDLNWHNIALSSDGTNKKLYIDGVLDNQNTSGTPPQNANPLVIGQGWSDNAKTVIDDYRFFDVSISFLQIKELYYAGLNKLLANGSISLEDYQSRLLTMANK